MPLQVGDLVRYRKGRWVVTKRDNRVRTVVLRGVVATHEVADDDPEVQHVAHLPTQWPFLAAKRGTSRIVQIILTRGARTVTMRALVDWAPTDPLHGGGVVYFRPGLNLRHGEVLVAHHEDGTTSRLNITKSFGTVVRRKAIEASRQSPPAPQTRYDHLLSDEEDET